MQTGSDTSTMEMDMFNLAITLKEWASKIESHFEKNFWIESDPSKRGRSGFYKDTVGKGCVFM